MYKTPHRDVRAVKPRVVETTLAQDAIDLINIFAKEHIGKFNFVYDSNALV